MTALAAAGFTVIASGCAGDPAIGGARPATAPPPARAGPAARIASPQGWTVSLFTAGTPALSHPSAIDRDGDHVWVAYQNGSTPDGGAAGGAPSPPSTVVDYDLVGQVRQAWSIPGRVDGLRSDPANHRVWVTSNAGAEHLLEIIDAANPVPQRVEMPPPPQGGGYGDLAFVGGAVYVTYTRPDPARFDNGSNPFPAAGAITVAGAASATVTPILAGSGTAMDAVSGSGRAYNLTDPDSLTGDGRGDLVLAAPADALLMTVRNPGSDAQRVTATPLQGRVSDAVWTTSTAGRFLILDSAQDAVYSVEWGGRRSTAFAEVSTRPGAPGFVGAVDLRTGAIIPLITGLDSPGGLAFVPES